MGRAGKKQRKQRAPIKLGVRKILKCTKILEANHLQQGARHLVGKGQCGGKVPRQAEGESCTPASDVLAVTPPPSLLKGVGPLENPVNNNLQL